MTKKIVGSLVIVIIVIALLTRIGGNRGQQIVESDLVVKENYTPSQEIIFKNNAKLTVKGDLSLKKDSKLTCDGGPLVITVLGNAEINGTLSCILAEDTPSETSGIILIVGKGVTFGSDAVISSNSHIQVVRDFDLALDTQAEIDAAYEDAGKNTGAGPRIGPFVEANATVDVSGSASVSTTPKKDSIVRTLIAQTAYAQTPRDKDGNALDNIVISGNWYVGDGGNPPAGLDIPKPPKGVHKIILYFAFGAEGNVELRDFHLVGPAGRDGDSDENKNCVARGARGENAFRMKVDANNITINNFRLELGNGGHGGTAETKIDCDPGIATGGDGGEAGNFKMNARGSIEIASFHIVPGVGGTGGDATAHGKDGVAGCPGVKGGDATATGGNGGKNKKELAAIGAVSGIANVTVDEVKGGWGGNAAAQPGKGGDGNACKCGGGKGGNGTATGGKGGDASVTIPGAQADVNGGNGGNTDSQGATGGVGRSRQGVPQGGTGGAGGDASSKEGPAGKGTSTDGDDGKITNETGGNGGNGGDGCGPGNGGKGGKGKPAGKNGEKGKINCVDVKTDTKVQVGTPPPSATPPPVTTPPPTQKAKEKVINYNGKYLPIDQLIIEDEVGCGADHYHAARGSVVATDGSTVYDPGPQCGYGKVKDKPTLEVEVTAQIKVGL